MIRTSPLRALVIAVTAVAAALVAAGPATAAAPPADPYGEAVHSCLLRGYDAVELVDTVDEQGNWTSEYVCVHRPKFDIPLYE